jgi:hypothetical protein
MTEFEILPERRVVDFRHSHDHSQSWEERMLGEDGKTRYRIVQAGPWHETLFQPAFLDGDVVRFAHQDEYRIRVNGGFWRDPADDGSTSFDDAEIRRALTASPESYQFVGNLADLKPVPVEHFAADRLGPEFVNPHRPGCWSLDGDRCNCGAV